MCAQMAPSGECLRGKGPPDRMLAKPWRRLFLAAYTLRAINLVVAAVLRDSLCVLSMLPCMADCCMLYTVCKVERVDLTIIKRRLVLVLLLLLLLLLSTMMFLIVCNSTLCISRVYDYELYWFYGNHVCILLHFFFSFVFFIFIFYFYFIIVTGSDHT